MEILDVKLKSITQNIVMRPRWYQILIGVVLGIISPGLGHLYWGRNAWAIALVIFTLVLSVTLSIFSSLGVIASMGSIFIYGMVITLNLIWLLYVMFKTEKRKIDYGFVILSLAILLFQGLVVERANIRAAKMESAAMRPTLNEGDYFLYRAFLQSSPVRENDIVVIDHDDATEQVTVRQVISVQGNELHVKPSAPSLPTEVLDRRSVVGKVIFILNF